MPALRAVHACFAFTAGVLTLFESCCTADAQRLKCDTGPLQRTYAATQWLVYSCEDTRSLVFVTPQGNPAMPFYFFLRLSDGGYRLEGEGTGNKDVADSVAAELQRLSDIEIASLINETRAVAPAKNH
jgi:hypothetical protein